MRDGRSSTKRERNGHNKVGDGRKSREKEPYKSGRWDIAYPYKPLPHNIRAKEMYFSQFIMTKIRTYILNKIDSFDTIIRKDVFRLRNRIVNSSNILRCLKCKWHVSLY